MVAFDQLFLAMTLQALMQDGLEDFGYVFQNTSQRSTTMHMVTWNYIIAVTIVQEIAVACSLLPRRSAAIWHLATARTRTCVTHLFLRKCDSKKVGDTRSHKATSIGIAASLALNIQGSVSNLYLQSLATKTTSWHGCQLGSQHSRACFSHMYLQPKLANKFGCKCNSIFTDIINIYIYFCGGGLQSCLRLTSLFFPCTAAMATTFFA